MKIAIVLKNQNNLFELDDKQLVDLLHEVRDAMKPGHPPYPYIYWTNLCDAEVALKMERINRAFTEGYQRKSIKRIKYT